MGSCFPDATPPILLLGSVCSTMLWPEGVGRWHEEDRGDSAFSPTAISSVLQINHRAGEQKRTPAYSKGATLERIHVCTVPHDESCGRGFNYLCSVDTY